MWVLVLVARSYSTGSDVFRVDRKGRTLRRAPKTSLLPYWYGTIPPKAIYGNLVYAPAGRKSIAKKTIFRVIITVRDAGMLAER